MMARETVNIEEALRLVALHGRRWKKIAALMHRGTGKYHKPNAILMAVQRRESAMRATQASQAAAGGVR
jgi:hypothetical protein